MRFWIKVDSLKRPPTLLTIASSFRSSSMFIPFKMTPDKRPQIRHGRVQVVVNYNILILADPLQFALGTCQTALDGIFGFRLAGTQPLFVHLQRGGPQENR